MDRLTLNEIQSIDWMHTIDLGHGVVTAGKWPVNRQLVAAFDKLDFKGKKVLDVGTCNGLWSFEAERRGAATVYSVDFLTHVGYWCAPGYRLAHRLLQSKAKYNPDLNVYDVAQLGERDFDIVIFAGLYYHLKNPLLALARLRTVMTTGGLIVIEGPVLRDQNGAVARFVYKDHEKDRSNWWIPSRDCLREWVECSRFRILEEFPSEGLFRTRSLSYRLKRAVKRIMAREEWYAERTVLLAEAVRGKDDLYASIDPELADAMS